MAPVALYVVLGSVWQSYSFKPEVLGDLEENNQSK